MAGYSAGLILKTSLTWLLWDGPTANTAGWAANHFFFNPWHLLRSISGILDVSRLHLCTAGKSAVNFKAIGREHRCSSSGKYGPIVPCYSASDQTFRHLLIICSWSGVCQGKFRHCFLSSNEVWRWSHMVDQNGTIIAVTYIEICAEGHRAWLSRP